MPTIDLVALTSSLAVSIMVAATAAQSNAAGAPAGNELIEPPPLPPTTIQVTLPAPDPSAIEKADKLHQAAAEALARLDLKTAIDIERQAAAIAPTYWLPHEALAYLYEKIDDGPSAQEAAEALKMEHPLLADLNFALLLQSLRQYKESLDYFLKVIKNEPHSWKANLGIAESYRALDRPVEAREALSCLPTDLKDPAALSLLADLYRRLGNASQAAQIVRQAEDLSPDTATQLRLRICRFKLAVQSGDMKKVAELKREIGDRMPESERQWMRIAAIKLATSADQANEAVGNALAQSPDTRELREYAKMLIAHADEQASANGNRQSGSDWLRLARQILTKAQAEEPNIENTIELAALDKRLGNDQAALETISKVDGGNDQNGPHLLISAIVKTEHGYKSYIDELSYTIPEADCRCHYNTARGTIRNISGVIAVFVDQSDKPTSHALFDRRKTSSPAILANQGVKRLKNKIVMTDERQVKSLAEMAALVSAQDGDLLAGDDTFTPVPLQFPKLQAKIE